MLHNIYFTDTELDAQAKTIVDFLAKAHPELNNKSAANTCVELRPINRSGEFNIRLNRSLNLWKLDDKSIDRLKAFLCEHNGKPYCLYYSVFAFDYSKDAYTKAGRKAVKGKITSDAALFTHELVLDFDNINHFEFENILKTLNNLGIDTMWVFTGHGYQLHIFLEEPLYNRESLYSIVCLFRAKGFMCDPSCIDSARLMRLPFTYNCKCFANEEYDDEYNSPPLCKIYKETDKRYSFDAIVEVISSLPTVNPDDEKLYLESLVVNKNRSNKVLDETSIDDGISISMVEYPEYLLFDDLPEPVIRMLRETPFGFRNSTLGILIRYFKQYLLLGKQQIHEILTIWARQSCNPAYNEIDFEKDFERLYLASGLNYSSELAKHFGYIDFDSQIKLHRDNKIPISNIIFQSLDVIDGNVLRAYLAVKILDHGNCDDEDDIPVTINAIADLTGMSIPTLKRVLPIAKKMKLLYTKQGAKRKGEPNTYHCNHINDSEAGFKALSVNDLDVYLSTSKRLKLSNNELKVYLFMLYKFYTKDRAMSLKKIAKFVGLTESAVSKIVKSLCSKRYLKIERIYKDNIVFFNKYTLLK